MSNYKLNEAKKARNDEFYTQIKDIENELHHYKKYFRDAIIFCNCDDPEESDFWKYFFFNDIFFELKGLIATHYDPIKPTYKLELRKIFGKNTIESSINTISLKGNGDFRSPECIEILKSADIVVTNPPFSLFREYIDQLMEYEKKFLVIGNMNAITYKNVFRYIMENKMWLGITKPKEFRMPDDYPLLGSSYINEKGQKIAKAISMCWFTNLPHSKRNEPLILYKRYNPEDYPKYDNYDAINVDRVVDIPEDYYSVMGVPITFLDKYCPEQFEILGCIGALDDYTRINGKKRYKRLLIRRKK